MKSQGMLASSERLDGIQGMRFVAALGVLLVHLQWKLMQFHGVDFWPHVTNTAVHFFFVISGFVISLAISQIDTTPAHFMGRRFLRIYPPYFVLTVCAAVVYFLRPEHVNSSGGTTNVLASFLLIPGPYKFLNENAWTIPHEFAFYAVASITLLFRAQRIAVLAILLVLWAVLDLVFRGAAGEGAILMDFGTGIAAWIVAGYLRRRAVVLSSALWLALPLTLAALTYFGFWHSFTSSPLVGINMPWGLSLIVVSLMDAGGVRNRFTQALAALGDRSYAIYLVHPFTIKAQFLIAGTRPSPSVPFLIAEVLTGLVVAILAGSLFYRYVEVPLRLHVRMPRRAVAG